MKCQIEYILDRLRKKMSYNQIFVVYLQYLLIEENDFKQQIPNHYYKFINNIIDYLNGAEKKFLYKYEKYSCKEIQMNNLNFPEISEDVIFNIMEVKNQDIKNIFLKYFIPLFQLKINVKLFGEGL